MYCATCRPSLWRAEIRQQPHGINSEGLKRRDVSAGAIEAIRRAYKTLYRTGMTFEEAKQDDRRAGSGVPEVQVLVDFLAATTRGIIR